MSQKPFTFGYGHPHFFPKIDYNWASNPLENGARISAKLDEIAALALVNSREYVQQFGVFTSVPHYPYKQVGNKGIALHLGNGGRWIDIDSDSAAGFIYGHNLDSWTENAVAFNLASDILEFFEPGSLAPRLYGPDRNNLELRFPIDARGLDSVLANIDVTAVHDILTLARFTKTWKLDKGTHGLQLVGKEGTILFENNCCVAKDFNERDWAGASYVIAKILDFYSK